MKQLYVQVTVNNGDTPSARSEKGFYENDKRRYDPSGVRNVT